MTITNHELRALPVMISCATHRLAEEARERHIALVCDLLPKPFDMDDLYTKLSRPLLAA